MKILISIVALLLVAIVGIAGYFLLTKDKQQPAPSQSSSAVIFSGKVTGPSSPYKIPEALARAKAQNSDTVAWLSVPNTDINNSVLQSSDNSFYLRRNEQKQDEVHGCYFADYECAVGEREVLEPNTIIYGHSTPGDDPDGKRFSQLFRLIQPEFAKTTPYIYLATEQERLTFEIFAVFYTSVEFDYIQVQISNEEMREITTKAEELSLYDYDAQLTAEDKIITLSTCTEKFGLDGNNRFVVMGRLMPESFQEQAEANFTVK